MIRAVFLALLLALVLGPIRSSLLQAPWVARTPRVAVLLWQAVALTVGISSIGLCVSIALAPLGGPFSARLSALVDSLVEARPERFASPAQLLGLCGALIGVVIFGGGLIGTLAISFRASIRHRRVLDVISEASDEHPSVAIVHDDRPTAYTLGGIRPRVVVTTGALDRLTPAELEAVIEHERAHARGRHDLALVPFRSLRTMLPLREGHSALETRVRELLEIAADARSIQKCGVDALVGAMRVIGGVTAPEVTSTQRYPATASRIPRGLRLRAMLGVFALTLLAVGIVAAPITIIVFPGSN
jgi:Peptidase family M48